ncbi:MAG: IS3 family transposase [Mucilaginibacter sp.]
MKMQSSRRGLRGLCRLLGYSPQAYYKNQSVSLKQGLAEDLLLSQVLIHRKLQPRSGGRKLHEMLLPFMQEHELYIGRDQLFNLLRKNNLLVKMRRCNRPRTTDSNHWMRRYPDLVKDIKISRANGLWVSDITYIRLKNGHFCYLSLITDAYSRKIVGFHLSDNLSAEGPVRALEMALDSRAGNAPLIHHSDRGSQYCCDAYISLLKDNNISVSMTQSGDPRDNAIAERVNGILKQELLTAAYATLNRAHQSVVTAIDIYNRFRLHSSLDMMTPEMAHTHAGPIKRRWKSWAERQAAVPVY